MLPGLAVSPAAAASDLTAFWLDSLAVTKLLAFGVSVNLFKSAVACLATFSICGCDQGQPAPPAPNTLGQGASAISTPDFGTTKKAAESGDSEAQFELGGMYDIGDGVPPDSTEAAKWYRLAAEQGHPKSQHNIGSMYNNGEGVPQDYAEAMKWYRRAAEQGLAEARHNIGALYHNGEGVPQDTTEAAKWFRLAAEQGYADSQFSLGLYYGAGGPVPQDFVEAFALMSLAAEANVPQAVEFRDLAASELTPDQLAEAKKRATDLSEKYGSGE